MGNKKISAQYRTAHWEANLPVTDQGNSRQHGMFIYKVSRHGLPSPSINH